MGAMIRIKRVSESEWAALNPTGSQVLRIRKESPLFEIRRCLPSPGKGMLLAEFLGSQAFREACQWARNWGRRDPTVEGWGSQEQLDGAAESGRYHMEGLGR